MNWSWLTRDKLMGAAMGMLLMPVIQQTAPFLTVGILQSVQERFTFEMLMAEMDSVRTAAASVQCPPVVADAAVVSAALTWNLRVAHEKESNRHWWSDYFSTDRWSEVKPIQFSCGRVQ